MRWFLLISGLVLVFVSWAIVQLGKGVLFTYSEYEVWDDAFLSDYKACCLLTDLRSAAPFALIGIVLISLAVSEFYLQKKASKCTEG